MGPFVPESVYNLFVFTYGRTTHWSKRRAFVQGCALATFSRKNAKMQNVTPTKLQIRRYLADKQALKRGQRQ